MEHNNQIPTHSPVGWYSRATLLPANPPYKVAGENLVFAVATTMMAMFKSERLVAALFKPNIAIDGKGRVFALQQDGWYALVQLADAVAALPKSGETNTWEFKEGDSCSTTEWIYVATPNGLYKATISEREGKSSRLIHPVGNFTRIPGDMHTLLEHAYEANENIHREGEGSLLDEEVMSLLDPNWSSF